MVRAPKSGPKSEVLKPAEWARSKQPFRFLKGIARAGLRVLWA